MFAYATESLHLSEAEAYLRIAAARAARRHPVLLEMLADGRLHLSAMAKLAPHLTDANRERVLERAAHRTKRQIEELVAELQPRPDVAPAIRKLPVRRPEQEHTRPAAPPPVAAPATAARATQAELRPDAVAPGAPAAPPRPAVVQPIAPARYQVRFTASAELHEKLNRLRGLMKSSIPDGDLGALIEDAVSEKLERLEARRFAKTNRPRKSPEETDTTPSSRHIPAPIRRAVYARDGGRCCFVDRNGNRCTARDGLEFHHRHGYARGGAHSVANLELQCPVHNQYLAELEYGRDRMQRYRKGVREEMAPYAVASLAASGRALEQDQLRPDAVGPYLTPQTGPGAIAVEPEPVSRLSASGTL